jgi:hypothetical protein
VLRVLEHLPGREHVHVHVGTLQSCKIQDPYETGFARPNQEIFGLMDRSRGIHSTPCISTLA